MKIHLGGSQPSGMPTMVTWAAVLWLAAFGAVFSGLAADADHDGMDDQYEALFGLDAANPADAAFDGDNDGLTAFDESILGTDPFVADTDRDGLDDGVDPEPLSDAYMGWGDPFFTAGDGYWYAGPAWWLGAWKDGGEWTTNGWEVAAGVPDGVGRLLIDLDPTLIAGDLLLEVELFDRGGSSLFVDVLDANDMGVLTDLHGNLMRGSNEPVSVTMPIPLSVCSNAASISLRRGTGEVTVYRSAVSPAPAAPLVDGGSALRTSGGDGVAQPLGDGVPQGRVGASAAAAAGPGYTISAAAAGAASAVRSHAVTNGFFSRTAAVIHVDARRGLDSSDGLAAARSGSLGPSGPKRTLRSGLKAARAGGTLVIHAGRYAESLNLAGRTVAARLDGDVVLGVGAGSATGASAAGGVTNLAGTALGAGRAVSVTTNAVGTVDDEGLQANE